MKKLLAIILSLLLISFASISSFAETLESSNDSTTNAIAYTNLQSAFNTIHDSNRVIETIYFKDASQKITNYLESINIDPNSVGLISYILDNENHLNINILVHMNNSRYASIVSNTYLEDNNGNLVLSDNLEIIDAFSISTKNLAQTRASDSSVLQYQGMNIYAVFYYDYVLAPEFIRPVQGSIFYTFIGNSFQLGSWIGSFTVGGRLYRADNLNEFLNDVPQFWRGDHYSYAPPEHQAIWMGTPMSSDYCLNIYGFAGDMYYAGTFAKITNGVSREYTITIGVGGWA